jgi:hypothetical protein
MIYDLKLPHWATLLNCPFCGDHRNWFLMVKVFMPDAPTTNA